jgi:hypothetical protein
MFMVAKASVKVIVLVYLLLIQVSLALSTPFIPWQVTVCFIGITNYLGYLTINCILVLKLTGVNLTE